VLSRRILSNLDYVTIIVMLAIMAFGVVAIASATRSAFGAGGDDLHYVKLQLAWAGFGLAVMIAVLVVDYASIARYWIPLYLANLVLLGSVVVLGRAALGAQRWLEFGPLSFQPSETAKIAIIVTLAAQLATRKGRWRGARDYVVAGLHVLPPMALVLMQPDLGTSLVFVAVVLGILVGAGAPLWQLFVATFGGLAAAVGAIWAHLVFGLPLPLKSYQISRLIVFWNPNVDLLGAGYHLRQSLIAVGSGRLLGKGLFAGAQSQLNFLPAQHTDFVFSVVGEELGFVGAVAVLLLYLVLLYKGVAIALRARDVLGSLIAYGVVAMLAFHIIVNVGMTIGIMPITGLPLPFMSYGGSALISNCIAVGLLLNVCSRRHRMTF